MTTVRADVAAFLREGLSGAAIACALHTDAKAVSRARSALRLPKVHSGPRAAATRTDLFLARVTPTEDGHLLWTGARQPGGCPVLRYAGRLHTAARVVRPLARTRPRPAPYGRDATGPAA